MVAPALKQVELMVFRSSVFRRAPLGALVVSFLLSGGLQEFRFGLHACGRLMGRTFCNRLSSA